MRTLRSGQMPKPIVANAGESSGPDGGPCAHACIVEVSQEFLSALLGIPQAGGLLLAMTADLDGRLRLLVQHPDAPEQNGPPYRVVRLEESVWTCEHGGVTKREVKLRF